VLAGCRAHVEMGRSWSLPMQRDWARRRRRSDEKVRVRTYGGGGLGERQQRGEGGHRPLRGSRAGDRFALTVISLALDGVDATPVSARRRGSERQT
jgi:hypothetical protein